MKEQDFLKIIENTTKSAYLGDDCAFIKQKEFVITQDNFIEDVHFKTVWATPFQIGYKSCIVNISDILASGGEPKYLMIGLSLPKDTKDAFVEELYKGIKQAAQDAEIIGGDITSGDRITLSICAIGDSQGRHISSRSNAKAGYKIITTGEYGSGEAGLLFLQGKNNNFEKFKKNHLEPTLDYKFSKNIALNAKQEYAMMDTSDGLADALYKIAESSNITIEIDYNKIPHDKNITDKNLILFGAEDYNLIAAVPEEVLKYLGNYTEIGYVKNKERNIKFKTDGKEYTSYDELVLYDHFGE